MYNDKAMVSGAALKELILDRLPHKLLEQMHTINLTGETDDEIISSITNAGRTAEKWDAARNNLGPEKSIADVRQDSRETSQLPRQSRYVKAR